MKDPQKIEAVCYSLADAKYEMHKAIEKLEEMQSDDMAARLRDALYELQEVLSKAYSMKWLAEEQAHEAH